MRASIHFIDRGSQTVELDMDVDMPKRDRDANQPTPAAVLALATKALFENGLLARAGQLALEGASKGQDPAEYLKERIVENDNANP